MRGYMFRNRWGALFFVAMTAVGAATLIGGEDDDGMLLSATEDLRRQKLALDATFAGEAEPQAEIPADGAIEFTSDEELVDPAAGIDPTPIEDGLPPPPELVPLDEVIIVSRDDRAGQ